MMNEKERLRMAMGESASLPPEDPIRQQIEADIAKQGEWAEKEWLELLSQDEHFRIALRRVEIPPNLQRCLLEIPDRERKRGRNFLVRGLLTAAALVLVATVGVLVYLGTGTNPNSTEYAILQDVAARSVEDHLNHRNLKVETSDTVEFKSKLTGKVPFEVVVPELGNDFKLQGGRVCKFGTRPIIYSLWKAPKGDYSLVQLKLSDFGLRSTVGQQLVKPKNPLLANSPCEVLVWAQGDMGFVLVADRGEFLHGIFPR
jgi:hypothetical protein